ncbi:MAG: InlB B-repeat-containing protein [Bacteroidales bacterium]|nr:InlB B-repeat-containing protein [Bacteroidales bacterium]
MRKSIALLIILNLVTAFCYSQDYGTQVPNSDFESEWKTYKGNKKEGKEPYCWHSFMSANVTTLTQLAATDHIDKSEKVRPGSTGVSSVVIYPKKVFGVIANGSLTNGRMNAKSTTAKSDDNNIFTDRSKAEFNTKITEAPDSITVWLCFYSSSASNQAAFHCAVHGDSDFILYGSGKDGDASQQYSDANYEFTRTTESSSDLVWQRMSIPFLSKGNCTEPKYVLVTMSTNKTPAEGNESDRLYVDDIVLIYNPTLKTGTLAQTEYEGDANGTIDIQVPFTLTGSMSVSNLNKKANQVIAQLSDANGNFDNPIELGRLTTNTSGVVEGKIPASVGDGNYKVRVVSTNYPMTAEPSSSEITVKRYYQVAFDAYDSEIVSLTGAGKYYVAGNKNVTISANVLSDEYTFSYWSENESVFSLEPSYSFEIDKSHTLSVIVVKQCVLVVSAEEGGTVSTEGGMYVYGDGVNVVATPDEGYKFLNWTVDDEEVSTNPSYSFVMDGNKNLVAHFIKAVQISAVVNLEGAGAIAGTGTFLLEKDSVEVTLVVVSNDSEKYLFVNWTEGDSVVCEASTYTFKTNSDKSLTANFVTRVTLDVVATEGGNVTGAGTYESGKTVSLLAVPDEGFRFAGWFEADTLFSESVSIQLETNANRMFEARFVKQFVVSVSSETPAVNIQGSGVYDAGAVATIVASIKQGWIFKNWMLLNEIVSKELTYEFVVDSSVNLVAIYEEIPKYIISVQKDPVVGGTVTGVGEWYENELVTLTVEPNNGFDFVNWTENDEVVSTETTIRFEASENRNLIAHFNANFVGRTVSLTAEEGGEVSGAGLYEENTTVTVNAMPSEKYIFDSWTDKDGNVLSTNASYTFELADDVELFAHFERVYVKFDIEVSSADESKGMVEGSKKYTEEDVVVVKAVPSQGYRFLQWLENGEVVSTSEEYSFICDSKRDLVAEFQKIYTVSIADFEGGTVRGLENGIFDENSTITLAVTVDEEHKFVAWRNAEDSSIVSSSAVYTFVADADRNLIVDIKEKGKLCTISVQTGGTITGLRNGQYEAGETVQLVATSIEGYVFRGWVSNGEIIETSTLLTFVVSDDMDIHALFVPEAKSVDVKVFINDETFGSVIGAGIYTEGDEIQLIASPSMGYEFVGWTKNGKLLSNLSTLYITVVDDCEVFAEFKLIEKVEEEITGIEDVDYESVISVVERQVMVDGLIPDYVVDIQGRKVLNKNLKSGIYFVRLENRMVSICIR